MDPESLTLASVPGRVTDTGDPWAAMTADPQAIDDAVARWHRDLAAGILDAPWPPVYPKQPHEPPRVNPSRARVTDEPG